MRAWLSGRRGSLVYRVLVLGILIVVPLAHVLWAALVDPEIAFLVPIRGAAWMRHPEHDVVNGDAVAEATFTHRITIEGEPRAIALHLHAFGDLELTLDGDLVAARAAGMCWKRGCTIDLGPALHTGENEIAIRVVNRRGNPALAIDAPDLVRSPAGWLATLPSRPDAPVAAVPALFRSPRPGPLQQSRAWRWVGYATPLWLLAWASLGGLAAVTRWSEGSALSEHVRSFERRLPLVIVLAALAFNVVNALDYPYSRSIFDWEGHVAYVEHVAATWRPPLAGDGFEMYHPPIYYFCAAVTHALVAAVRPEWALKAVQLLGAVAGGLLPMVTWRQLRLLRPEDVRGTWIATALAAFLPMSLYINPAISNEPFAATLTALAILLALRLLLRAAPRVSAAAGAGVVAGAALLAKVTAAPAFLAALSCLALRALRSGGRHPWSTPACFTAAAVAVAGWFYARNVLVYGAPLVSNFDGAAGFAFHQEPTYRTAGFFLSFTDVFVQHPTRSLWTSFLGGHYASVWADAHSTFFAQTDTRAFLAMSVLMLLGVAPSVATLVGFLATLVAALRSPRNLAALLLSGVVLVTAWAMVALALQAPHYSSIKASYWLSLVPSLAVCFAAGRARIDALWCPARIALDATSIACVLFSAVLYLQ